MSIYGGYDRDALDAQYRARGRTADYDSFLPRWIRDRSLSCPPPWESSTA